MIKAGIVGLVLASCCQHYNTNQKKERSVQVLFTRRFAPDYWNVYEDRFRYSFTSPTCPGPWKGVTDKHGIEFKIPAECDDIIPLVGYVIPHHKECRTTYYQIRVDQSEREKADLVIQTNKDGLYPRTYIIVDCDYKE